jgi:hypothetical protein
MSKKTLGMILLVGGVLVVIAVVIGGVVGFPSPGFGLKKIAGVAVGLIALLVGLGFTLQKKTN